MSDIPNGLLTATVYLHGNKESMYAKGRDLGLTDEAMEMFKFACYEVAVELSVDPASGVARIVKVDGRKVES